MSKIGRYVVSQIEKGNFWVDHRGDYHVPQPGANNRKERVTKKIATDTVRRDGNNRQCSNYLLEGKRYMGY